MRDCVVVGCGRSGTSLAAGLLARAGHDCGEDLLPLDEGGPTGFFEARRTNELNELLLAPHLHAALERDGYSRPLRVGESWLAVLPPDVEIEAPRWLRDGMGATVPASPYCLKDPRFAYTLDAWRPLLREPLFVCVFRHPHATGESIARDVRYGDLRVEFDTAVAIWSAVYARVLDRHRHEGDWEFVHYEQLLDGGGVDRLARRVGVPLDHTFADPALRRSTATAEHPPAGRAIYDELCAAAGCAR